MLVSGVLTQRQIGLPDGPEVSADEIEISDLAVHTKKDKVFSLSATLRPTLRPDKHSAKRRS